MINAFFIDFKTLLDKSTCNLMVESVFALKDMKSKIDDIRIVCINSYEERQIFDYEHKIDQLSQMLNLKKSLFFDVLPENNDLSQAISKWIKTYEKPCRSFAIVMLKEDKRCLEVAKTYSNNYLFCDESSFSEKQAKNAIWIMSNFKDIITKDDESNIWFISDTHFSHKNIIRYCNRPWNHGKDINGEIIATDEDVLNMDNDMIKRWNSVVGQNDIVWHLGDFAFGGKENAERVFPQLNGKINLVMGNHDHWKLKWYYDLGFHRVYDRKVIINDFVILSHTPLQFLNSNSPFFNVYGHVHDSTIYQTWTKNSCCVCVERHDYCPVSWKTIKQKYEEMNGNE